MESVVSVEALRAEAVASLHDELGRIRQSRKRKLQELYAVERHTKRLKPFPSSDIVARWGESGAVLDELEQKFLDENDIEKGLLFKESTLATFFPPIAHAPKPVEQEIAAPVKTPAPLRAQPSQSPSPAPSPAPSTIAPIIAAPKVTHLPSPPETQAHAPSPARLQEVAPAPSPPPQEVAPKQLPVPSPPPLRQVTPTATLEVRTNGHAQEAVTVTPPQEQRKPLLAESRTIPSTPSPQPLSQPQASSPSPSPSVEKEAEDHAAAVVEIGGVPVVKGAITEIPNERETAAGVHVPPVPPELNGENHISMSETESEAPPSPPVPPKKSAPTPKKRSPPPPPLALEIPDSQQSIKGATPPPPSLGTPPTPPQTSQLSPPARLTVVTDHPPRRSPVPSEKESQVEISSPASSIAASTPDNIISSATSPDAHQIPEPSKPQTVVEEDHGKAVEERPREEEVVAEQEVNKVAEKPEEPTLPSEAVAGEIVEQEEEEEVSLPTIPSKELPRGSPAPVEEHEEHELPRPIETEAAAPSSPVTESPVSPDPSAQLRLENQLANGVTRTLPAAPEEHPAALKRAKSPVVSPKEQPLVPSPKPEPAHVPSSPVEAPIADEEEEEEDRVQLVENRTPVVEKPASPVPEQLPVSVPEPKLQEEQESVAKEPSPAPHVEEELEKEPEVEVPAKPQLVVEEAPKEPEPEPPIPETVEIAVEVEAPPAPPSPKPPVEGMPDSLLIPVDKESEGEEEDEDIVMQDAVPPPKEPMPVVEKQATPEAAQPEVLDERIAKSPKLPEKPSQVEVPAIPEVSDLDEVDGIAIPETLPEALLEAPLAPSKAAEEVAAPPGSPKAPTPSSIESLSSLSDEAEPTPKPRAPTPQAPPTPAATQEEPAFVTPALFATPSIRSSARPKKPSQRAQLSKVVISSAHHAAAAAEAEAKRLREDQEQQGLIVVARRRTQQAAAGAARGRGPSVFPPGSKLEALTRYGVEEEQPKPAKPVDYMDPLYTISSYTVPVGDLLRRASKTVTTANHNLDHNDKIAQKVLQKIQELRSKGLWSFEQIRKAPEPPRKMAHWDYLLKEMKWLSVDYREERRLKIAEAKNLADLVKQYIESTPEQRAEMVVDRKKFGIVPKGIREQRKRRHSVANGSDQPTPELMESGGTPEEEDADEYFVKQEVQDDTVMDLDDDTGIYDHLNEPPPASIFALRPDETSFYMPKTQAAKDLLEELPLFGPPAPPPNGAEFIWEDAWSKNGIIPVSKYSLGRMEFIDEDRPLRKRKRYEYEINSEPFADDSEEEGDVVGGGPAYDSYGRPKSRDKSSRPLPLHPEQNNVALFRPEFKPTLQRIRNHVFRPPMDQPPQAFFESRNPSLWTADEDEKLRLLTKEYNFNWQLVSVYMDMEGEYHSGAERRSPWECFERWMSIENVPPDFSKSPYYKGVQQRLEIAQRSSQQHIQAAASGSQHVNTLKRRGTLPTKVDRRRTTRTFTQMEAMRKLAKKRETTLTKQAQSNRAAQVAAMRKQSSNTNNSQLRTPQYFSTMKHEKDVKAMEQKALMVSMSRGQPIPGRVPNGVPIPGQPGRVATPVPGQVPNGYSAHPAVRSPGLQHPLQAQYANAMRHPSAANLTPQQQQQVAQMRIRAMQQQQLMQQAAAAQQAQQQLPSQAEILARVQALHPQLTHEQAQIQAQKQLAHYHDQLRNNMAQQQVRRPQGGVRASGTGGTGVLIGANGPIGPGAAQLQAQQQQQQQQQAQQQQQSRSATPVVMQGQQVQSPGVPQPPPQQQQQQLPQETPATTQ